MNISLILSTSRTIDEIDERVIENQIIQNIKKFIMALGSNFSFLGNQYRLIVDEQEYFIDLLFFNRHLQALVAIMKLKRGEFKPNTQGNSIFISRLWMNMCVFHTKTPLSGLSSANRNVRKPLNRLSRPLQNRWVLPHTNWPTNYLKIMRGFYLEPTN